MGTQDIKKLFLYEHEWEIKEGDEVVGTVYQRILNDADIERARRESLRESAVLRKKLKDENSDEHAIFISPIFEVEKEEIIAGIITAELKTLRDSAYHGALKEIPFPKRLDTEDLEKQEKYQEKVDSYNTDITKKTIESLGEKTKERAEELEKEEEVDKLRKIYIGSLRNSLCSSKMLEIYQLWAAYLGTYKDKKCTKRLFDSFEEFRNTATELQRQLIDGYFFLEIDRLTLKK